MKKEFVEYKIAWGNKNIAPYFLFESSLFAIPKGIYLRYPSLKRPFNRYIISSVFIENGEKLFYDYIKTLKREAEKLNMESVGIIVPEEKIPDNDVYRNILKKEGFDLTIAGFYTEDMKVCLKKCWITVLNYR
ncbi:MAG: hypothetical protein QXX38_03080 [Candidatus Aenigmatarchaeota archaeon]